MLFVLFFSFSFFSNFYIIYMFCLTLGDAWWCFDACGKFLLIFNICLMVVGSIYNEFVSNCQVSALKLGFSTFWSYFFDRFLCKVLINCWVVLGVLGRTNSIFYSNKILGNKNNKNIPRTHSNRSNYNKPTKSSNKTNSTGEKCSHQAKLNSHLVTLTHNLFQLYVETSQF